MSTSRTALVTGAGGAIGPDLVRRLLAEGYHVKTLIHHAAAPIGLLPESVEIYLGDICDRQLVRDATAGANVVFHLAARLHDPNPRPESLAEYERVNVEGTRTVLEAAKAARAERFVFFSTVSVYGSTGHQPVDEEYPLRADTHYANTKLRAEKIVLSSGLGVVLRMAAVYGPRMKGNYISLARALDRGLFVPIGPGTNLRTLVYSADAVEAACLAAEHPLAVGKVYNVSDGSIHSISEIITTICEALGKAPPRVTVPVAAARPAAVAADALLAVLGRPHRFTQAIDKLTETVAVGSRRIQAELGFRPEFGMRDGWRATIKSWREQAGRADASR